MRTIIYQKLYLVIIVFIIIHLFSTSCKKDKNDVSELPQETLTANAGIDQTTDVDQKVTLNGSASVSSLHKSFQYKWILSNKPSGSNTLILNDTLVKPTFVPDLTGVYEITLTISNTSGQNSDKVMVIAGPAQPAYISQNIEVETVLNDRTSNPDLPDYIVTKDVAVSAQLTLQPGVVIQFKRDTRLDINDNGIIIAKGTPEKMIKFTGEENTTGFWKGITIFSNSSGNTFEYVQIINAGSVPGVNATKSALTLFGISHSYLSLKHCLIQGSGGYGMYVVSGAVLGSFEQNTFVLNSYAGVLTDAINVPRLDKESVFTGNNGRDVIEVYQTIIDNSTHTEEEWKGFLDHTPYRFIGDMFIATGWKLNPGVTIESASQVVIEVSPGGYLNAVGTLEYPIVFTGATKIKGFWKGIRSYATSSLNRLENVEVGYAGSSAIYSNKKANIAVIGSNSALNIKNSKITDGGGYGIYVAYLSGINDDAASSNSFVNISQDNILKE